MTYEEWYAREHNKKYAVNPEEGQYRDRWLEKVDETGADPSFHPEEHGPFFVWAVELNKELLEMGTELYEAYKIMPGLVEYINTMYKQGVSPSKAANVVLEVIDKKQTEPRDRGRRKSRIYTERVPSQHQWCPECKAYMPWGHRH